MSAPVKVHGDATSGAILSECGKYRYRLWRRWKNGFYATRGILTFIMLNPSTADHAEDDPTVRRCIGYGKDMGFDGIQIVNLFAWRATDPKELRSCEDPEGPDNDLTLEVAFRYSKTVVAAWGADTFARKRAERVAAIAWDAGIRLQCLARLKGGAPGHPLYLPKNAALQEWRNAG